MWSTGAYFAIVSICECAGTLADCEVILEGEVGWDKYLERHSEYGAKVLRRDTLQCPVPV